jgi:hypothetical protein
MTFGKAQAKVAALQALKQLAEFEQYVGSLVECGTLTVDVLNSLTNKIRVFQQQVTATLGERYQPTPAYLLRPETPASTSTNGIPDEIYAKPAPWRLNSRSSTLVEDDDD